MKLSVNDIVLKVLGLLLLVAAGLKGYQLLTEPVANADIWSNRYFLIFTVEFELALGIWLLSGLFKKAAWLVGLLCFAAFSCITLYKGITGADSCGCFGAVKVNPWITLLAIDLPAVVGLFIIKPKNACNIIINAVSGIFRSHTSGDITGFLPDLASRRLIFVSSFTILLILTSSLVLAVNEPAAITSSYEVLEPETWVGKELPILEHIDIAEKIKTGNWLLLLYHHDCPDCQKAIIEYEKIARDLQGNEDFLQIALIEVPPYGHAPILEDTSCVLGKLDNSKEWFVTTPAISLMANSKAIKAWQEDVPRLGDIVGSLATDRPIVVGLIKK